MIDDYDVNMENIMKETIELVWNAVGIEKSDYYNDDGSRKHS